MVLVSNQLSNHFTLTDLSPNESQRKGDKVVNTRLFKQQIR